MEIIFMIVLNSAMIGWTMGAQVKSGVDDRCFKLKKLKKLSFLFIGTEGRSAKKHGLVKSLFISQILGYAFALGSDAMAIILPLIFNIDFGVVAVIVLIIFGIYMVILIAITSITRAVSRKRIEKMNM